MNSVKNDLFTAIAFGLLMTIASCSQIDSDPTESEKMSAKVSQAIEQAKKSDDTRLYATSGRRITLPGISAQQQQDMIARCGKKHMDGTGDTLKNIEQRQQRKALILFMTSYNKAMSKICLDKR